MPIVQQGSIVVQRVELQSHCILDTGSIPDLGTVLVEFARCTREPVSFLQVFISSPSKRCLLPSLSLECRLKVSRKDY